MTSRFQHRVDSGMEVSRDSGVDRIRIGEVSQLMVEISMEVRGRISSFSSSSLDSGRIVNRGKAIIKCMGAILI